LLTRIVHPISPQYIEYSLGTQYIVRFLSAQQSVAHLSCGVLLWDVTASFEMFFMKQIIEHTAEIFQSLSAWF